MRRLRKIGLVALVLLFVAFCVRFGGRDIKPETKETPGSIMKSSTPDSSRHPGPAEKAAEAGQGRSHGGSNVAAGDAPAKPATFRMRIGQFAMSGNMIRLDHISIAEGRVKAPPMSVAFYRLEFEAFDADDHVVYRGSLAHPTKRIAEFEDPQHPGQFSSVFVEDPTGAVLVRLPVELAVARISFTEVTGQAGDPAAARNFLTSITLPR